MPTNLLFVCAAADNYNMNWLKLVSLGHIKEGELHFVGKDKRVIATVKTNGSLVSENGVDYARPGKLWTQHFKESKRQSWWDHTLQDGVTLRDIKAKAMGAVRERTQSSSVCIYVFVFMFFVFAYVDL